MQQERAARERELDYQPRKVNRYLSILCVQLLLCVTSYYSTTLDSTTNIFFLFYYMVLLVTVYRVWVYNIGQMFCLELSFLSFWFSEGEDCERNRDPDHSEKSKKIHWHVVRKIQKSPLI